MFTIKKYHFFSSLLDFNKYLPSTSSHATPSLSLSESSDKVLSTSCFIAHGWAVPCAESKSNLFFTFFSFLGETTRFWGSFSLLYLKGLLFLSSIEFSCFTSSFIICCFTTLFVSTSVSAFFCFDSVDELCFFVIFCKEREPLFLASVASLLFSLRACEESTLAFFLIGTEVDSLTDKFLFLLFLEGPACVKKSNGVSSQRP